MNIWPFFKEHGKTHPVFTENDEYFRDIDQNRPVAEFDYVVFDTELTGLNRRHDFIISIGAVKIRNLKILPGETFHTYVHPPHNNPTDSTLIHRITPQQLEQAPHISQVLPEFLQFCGPSLLVGHYVDMDVTFVNKAARKLFYSKINNPCIDTLRLAQVYTETTWENYLDRFNYQVSYNLADLCSEYNLPAFSSHDALQDALQTAYLFIYLVKQLERHDYTTLKDLFNAGKSWRWYL